MIIGVIFAVYGLTMLGCAWTASSPALAAVCVFGGVGFLPPAAAWMGAGPAVFGKHADGSQPAWAVLLSASYLLLSAAVFHLGIRLRPEDPLNEIADGVFVGRRPLPGDVASLDARGIAAVLDMTAEVPAHYTAQTYRCLPVLDRTPPTASQLAEAAAFIAAQRGPVLVHCAAGHGRSATAVGAWMLSRDPSRSVDAVEAAMKQQRPGIRLSKGQRAALEAFRETLS